MASTVTIDLRQVARGLEIPPRQIQAVVELLDEGNTVPFITRYRKDQTGGLDEEQIREIQSRLTKLRLLAERKQTILRSIEAQGKLTEKLAKQIQTAMSTKRLEDLYLPYKPKKQTLATTARSRGLEELAEEILSADPRAADLDARARDFASVERQVASGPDALLGAGHILAEEFSERADLRQRLREILQRSGKIVTSPVGGEQMIQAAEAAAAEANTPAPQAEAHVVEAAATPPVVAGLPTEPPVATEGLSAAAQIPAPPSETGAVIDETQPASPANARADEAASFVVPASAGSEPESSPQDPLKRALQNGSEATPPEPPIAARETAATTPTASDASAATVPAETPAGDTLAPSPIPHPSSLTPQPAAAKRGKDRAKARQTKKEQREQKRKKLEERRMKAFRDYFTYSEEIRKIPPHRILAINRGERAKVLRVKIEVDLDAMHAALDEMLVPAGHPHADYLRGCARDALARLILPALEREVRRELTDRAEVHAVGVFARNLRNLLLQPPVHNRRTLAVDPGYKNGCKLAALDQFGNVLAHDVIFLVGKPERREEAKQKVLALIREHQLTVVAIGNGTACRDAEDFFGTLISTELQGQGVAFVIVNEAGASVYSTSQLGREEFPDYDATLRGAVSIGRRLLDPLSELVKIEPASIGVGLYQHDVKAKHLQTSLDDVVESCVNYVGVDVNTASPALLRYVSGLNQLTARRIYEYRREHGPFRSRQQLHEVAGLGEATFVQAAGFLKITAGDNPLDTTWIHPESYEVATRVLEQLGCCPADLTNREATAGLAQRAAAVDREALAKQLGVGMLTLRDILMQLARPGRDPREDLPPPVFKQGVLKLEDLAVGMELTGTVLNVVDFGCFVDIGMHDTGLVHVSRMADRFIRDPHEVVAVGDMVRVWVMAVDKDRRRVSLTMVRPGTERGRPPRRGEGQQAAEGGGDEGRAAGGRLPPEGRGARPPRSSRRPTAAGRAEGEGRPAGGQLPPEGRGSREAAGGRPPAGGRGGRQEGREGGRPPRPQRPPQGGRPRQYDRPPRAQYQPPPKPKPLIPITEEMKKGKEPLRTFGDLLQFYAAKQTSPEETPPVPPREGRDETAPPLPPGEGRGEGAAPPAPPASAAAGPPVETATVPTSAEPALPPDEASTSASPRPCESPATEQAAGEATAVSEQPPAVAPAADTQDSSP